MASAPVGTPDKESGISVPHFQLPDDAYHPKGCVCACPHFLAGISFSPEDEGHLQSGGWEQGLLPR